jgi:hypothetical protein
MEHMVPIVTGGMVESIKGPQRLFAAIRLLGILLPPACGPGQALPDGR